MKRLADTGPCHTATHIFESAAALDLLTCSTLLSCPESRGVEEALVDHFKRIHPSMKRRPVGNWIFQCLDEWFGDHTTTFRTAHDDFGRLVSLSAAIRPRKPAFDF